MYGSSGNKKLYGGYAVLALQNLGYSDNIIQNFWTEYEDVIRRINEDKALENIDRFLKGETKQVVFEGIDIPQEYNLTKISDLLEKHEFFDKKIKSSCSRVCNAFGNSRIIYVKDLYNKTVEEFISIHSVSQQSFDIFVKILKEIFK